MNAFRVHCGHLAGNSLTEMGQVVQFDADGLSEPISEDIAASLCEIPGFAFVDTVEVADAVPLVPEEPSGMPEGIPKPPPTFSSVTRLPEAEESAFIRWFNANAAEERARFVEAENLRRDELLRAMHEEMVTGSKYPRVLAAIARALFNLRRKLFGGER